MIFIIFDISVPLTSEMIATPLPCNITEYKTYLCLRVKYFVAPRGKGANMALLALKVADPCPRPFI